jgi:cyclopropane fatty-acyl-phospholipid synthase-like methyltransferase
MSTPEHLTCHILPEEYKLQAVDNINKTIAYMKDHNFNAGHISQLEVCPQWIMSQNTWDDQKNKFREEVKRLDAIRGEAFLKTFPEIGELYKVNVSKMWPV